MPRTVLIVEDDEPTQLLLVAVMRRAGLATAVAGNGQAAMDIIERRDDIACILLDLMMPEVDGQAVIAYMRERKDRIPIVICTAALPRRMPEFDGEIIRAVVRKPFDIEQLMTTVTEVVDSFDQTRP